NRDFADGDSEAAQFGRYLGAEFKPVGFQIQPSEQLRPTRFIAGGLIRHMHAEKDANHEVEKGDGDAEACPRQSSIRMESTRAINDRALPAANGLNQAR